MKSFNLSDWALRHRSLVWYFMIAFMAAGLFAYLQLGRQEDPDFTIKTMVIGTQWPGASPEEMTRQVTDRIEKKLEELESLDYTKSVTVAGQTTVFVYLRDTTKAADVAPTWARVGNMIADIKGDFPQGVIGPAFNDRFGDVFGNIYAFTGDGLTQRQLRDRVEDIRAKVLTVPNVGKVEILGAQDEMIFLEFSTRKIAALGLDNRSIIASLQAQNAVAPSGVFQEGPERISVRVNGQFTSEDSLKAINLRVNDRFFPLTDVATITRGYADPPTTLFRFNGQPAIALAIGMKSGANLLKFGEALKEEMSKILAEQPIGLGVHLVADQPGRCRARRVRLHGSAVRSGGHRPWYQLSQSWASSRSGRCNRDSAGSRDHLRRDGVYRNFTAAHFARRPDHRARASRRRRHDRRRNDGGTTGSGRSPGEGRNARLHLHCLSHADGHAGHRCRLYPDWPEHQQRRRIHLHLVRGHCCLVARVMDCRRVVHAVARRDDPAVQIERSSRRKRASGPNI
jgi:hypothetical protein